jgi:hypothetical protein
MLAPLLVANISLRRLYADGFSAGDPVKSDWWRGPKSEEPIGGVSSLKNSPMEEMLENTVLDTRLKLAVLL